MTDILSYREPNRSAREQTEYEPDDVKCLVAPGYSLTKREVSLVFVILFT